VIRGDIVVMALQGDHGKPRPALIVQSDMDALVSTHVAVLPLTSFASETPLLRIPIPATPTTGLSIQSFAMLDRMTTADRRKIGRVIGHVDNATLLAVNRAIAVFCGIA
jgi:mRNA interferase MazF